MNTNDLKPISNRTHDVTNAACGDRCFITYGTLLKTKNPILNNPRRTAFKAHHFQPAEDQSPESLDSLPHAFQRELRRLRKKESVLQMPECLDGCFCDDMVIGPGRLKKETRTIGVMLKRSVQSGFIKPAPNNPDQDEQVRSGQLQLLDAYLKPLELYLEVDIISLSTLLCCGIYDGYIKYDIERRYLYEADVEAEWKIVKGQGTCASYAKLL